MKVAMYYNNSDVRIEGHPKPVIQDGELLLKVVSSGICGSDVMEWYRIKKAPLVLGHEVSGEVIQVAQDVTEFSVGDRVVVTHHVPCEECSYCLANKETMCDTLRSTRFYPGGFSHYLRIPKINVQKGTLLLPGEVSYDAATFIEPLGCVIRGQASCGVREGHTVLVLGSGISGLLHIKLAKALGAKNVIATDISEYRAGAAKRAGADHIILATENVPEKLKEFNNNKLADIVIVSTGALPALKQSLESVERGGNILFFAPTNPGEELPIKVEDLWKNGVNIFTSYAATKKELKQALDYLKTGKIEVENMITHRLPLKDTERGFKMVSGLGEDSIKVIIRPHD